MYWLNTLAQCTKKIKYTRTLGRIILLISAPLTAFGAIYDGLHSISSYKEYLYLFIAGVISFVGYKMSKYKPKSTKNIPSTTEIEKLMAVIRTKLNTENITNDESSLQKINVMSSEKAPAIANKASSKAIKHATKPVKCQTQRQVPGRIKMCLTCDYWGGKRDHNTYQKIVYCKDMSDLGKCNNLKCGFRNQKMPAGSGVSCNYYEKWGPIK